MKILHRKLNPPALPAEAIERKASLDRDLVLYPALSVLGVFWVFCASQLTVKTNTAQQHDPLLTTSTTTLLSHFLSDSALLHQEILNTARINSSAIQKHATCLKRGSTQYVYLTEVADAHSCSPSLNWHLADPKVSRF